MIVKEMLKSFKNDNKDEIKKKISVNKLNSFAIISSSNTRKVEDQEINAFLDENARNINELTEPPMVFLDTPLNGFMDEIKESPSVWEIIDTEAKFLKQLTIVTQLFNPLLERLLVKYPVELKDVEIQNIFGNINDIYSDHLNLWNSCVSLPLSSYKVTKEHLCIFLMKGGFVKISTILSSYVNFMNLLPTIRKTIRKLENENLTIRNYIEWTKKYSRSCHEGCLWILRAPFQRIMQYKILLERVTSLSNDDQKLDLNIMINSVHNFLQQLNIMYVGPCSMADLKEKIVENNVGKSMFYDMDKLGNEEKWSFDILKPLDGFSERILIHEGKLKLKECCNKTTDVQCYLCNDFFIICKPFKTSWDKLKIYKGPMRLDKIELNEESQDSLVIKIYSDLGVIEPIYRLCGEAVEVKLWIEKFTKTISQFLKQFRDPIIHDILQNECLSKEDGYLSDENQASMIRSETFSFSFMSIDSTSSQTSSNSIENNNEVNMKSILKSAQEKVYCSLENL